MLESESTAIGDCKPLDCGSEMDRDFDERDEMLALRARSTFRSSRLGALLPEWMTVGVAHLGC